MRQATSEAKADAYLKAGSFGPFLSFFHQILHNSPADYNTTPVAHRTRASGHATPDNESSSPCPGNRSGDAMADIRGDLSLDEGDMSLGTNQDSSSYVDNDTIGPPEDSSTPPRHPPSFALSYHTSAPSSVQSPAQSSSLQAIDSTLEESSLYSNPAIVQDTEQKEGAADDKATVNPCLLNLLIPILWPYNVVGNISGERKGFKYRLGPQISFTARVDGIIFHLLERDRVIELIEVKKARRNLGVRVQEAAQFVAFISELEDQHATLLYSSTRLLTHISFLLLSYMKAKVTCQRDTISLFLLSMCVDEVYISLATWTSNYVAFLKSPSEAEIEGSTS